MEFLTKEEFINFLLTFEHKENKLYCCPDRFCKTNNALPNLFKEYELANKLIANCKKFDFTHIIRTPSSAIQRNNLNAIYGAYDIQTIKTKNNAVRGYILTILYHNFYWKFSFGSGLADKSEGGWSAWCKFKAACKDCGIDIKDYAITNGEQIKQEIESPLIVPNRRINYKKRRDHVNHLDFHAAYPSVIISQYPEFRQVFDKLRKPLGDIAVGFMQSEWVKYQYAHLAKLAINTIKDKLIDIILDMQAQDFEWILATTDGLWYRDLTGQNRLYHNKEEGTDYGCWRHDHLDCEFQAVGAGQYFYYENGKFNPVLRGSYKKDTEKPREEWNENDFWEAVMSKQEIYYDENKELFILME